MCDDYQDSLCHASGRIINNRSVTRKWYSHICNVMFYYLLHFRKVWLHSETSCWVPVSPWLFSWLGIQSLPLHSVHTARLRSPLHTWTVSCCLCFSTEKNMLTSFLKEASEFALIETRNLSTKYKILLTRLMTKSFTLMRQNLIQRLFCWLFTRVLNNSVIYIEGQKYYLNYVSVENEFSPKFFEKVSTILFSDWQLERSGGKKTKPWISWKKTCFQNFNLVFCVPVFIFGPGSVAKLHFASITQHKQDMGHCSLTKREC